MTDVVADQQILQGVAATLEWVNVDGDGVPTAPGGAVTIGVTNAAGTTVLAAATATTADTGNTGRYTRALTAAQTADLNVLTATWTDAGDASAHTTTVEIVGGYLISIVDAMAFDKSIEKRSSADIVKARFKATAELEWICDRAFTPRYERLTLDGPDDWSLTVPRNDLRRIVACSVDGTALTAGELAALHVYEDRRIDRDSTAGPWPGGQRNIVIAYEYGLSALPTDIEDAFLIRLRQKLNSPSVAGIPGNATVIQHDLFGAMKLATADRYKTGYAEVDGPYSRWSKRTDGEGAGAASAMVDLNPQYGSLFHGGRR